MLTVKDVIQTLKRFPKDAIVYIYDPYANDQNDARLIKHYKTPHEAALDFGKLPPSHIYECMSWRNKEAVVISSVIEHDPEDFPF